MKLQEDFKLATSQPDLLEVKAKKLKAARVPLTPSTISVPLCLGLTSRNDALPMGGGFVG